MNNLTFGNERFQYYETICSGAPAGERLRRRCPRVQTHMTNSRLTDPEVLELRYPVLLDTLRHPARLWRQGQMARSATAHSRGSGSWSPWNAPSSWGFRKVRPFGFMAGRTASSARTGCGARTGGSSRSKGSDQTVLEPGEAIIIKTPTGGGFGKKSDRR